MGRTEDKYGKGGGGERKGRRGERRRKEKKGFLREESGEEREGGGRGNKGRKHKKKGGIRGEREGYKIGFWNVAGLENKDRDFWEKLGEWDIMFLSETWLQEKGWERIKRWLPRGYVWKVQEAERRNKKGRAMGEMVRGRREGIRIEREKGDGKRREEGIMTEKVNLEGGWLRLVGVYVTKDIEEKIKKLGERMEDGEEGVRVLIGEILMQGREGKGESGRGWRRVG